LRRKHSRIGICAGVLLGALGILAGGSWAIDQPYAVPASSVPVTLSSAALAAEALAIEEPFVSPLGEKKALIVSGFGLRSVAGQPLPENHEGMDYAAPAGTPIRAARSGKVIFTGFSKMYVGRTDEKEPHRLIILRHADGQSSRYVHLTGLHVRPGAEVKSGQVLGVLAESDEWAGPVLHFEVRDPQGQAVDPQKLIKEVRKL
jgi:murein DD-endopeptidase MepM/ murein hydrolase activator NlpD